MKPAVIYSIVVEMLKAKRTGGAVPAGIVKLPDHARAVLSDLCTEAVADRRDIRHFRDTAESIFAVLLNCMQEVRMAESTGITTATKVRLVKADLMLKSDECWVTREKATTTDNPIF